MAGLARPDWTPFYFLFEDATGVPQIVRGSPPPRPPPGQVRFLVPSARREHDHVAFVPEDQAQEFMRRYPLARVGRQTG